MAFFAFCLPYSVFHSHFLSQCPGHFIYTKGWTCKVTNTVHVCVKFPDISCNSLLSCALNQPELPGNKSQGWCILALFSQKSWRVETTPRKSMLLSVPVLQSQQKCIVIFALVCCFAVLVALIFSAVDVWGEDEDGITEENCSKNCRWEVHIHKPMIYCQWFPVFSARSPLLQITAHSR